MNHFTPKIDSWAALNHLTSLSSEQVCKHDLSSSLHAQCCIFNEEKNSDFCACGTRRTCVFHFDIFV